MNNVGWRLAQCLMQKFGATCPTMLQFAIKGEIWCNGCSKESSVDANGSSLDPIYGWLHLSRKQFCLIKEGNHEEIDHDAHDFFSTLLKEAISKT